MFKKRAKHFKKLKIRGITWSCPRCGKPFTTEAQMTLHYLSCGG